MENKFKISDIKELEGVARKLIESFPNRRIFAFNGVMGAGKTTFIKVICNYLGADENLSSPTYSLVNEYLSENKEPLYHFDFYRIETIDEVYDIGYEEYFFSGNYCFLEWPEKIEQLLPEDCVYISINENEDKTRTVSF